jgi:hypothetical protein
VSLHPAGLPPPWQPVQGPIVQKLSERYMDALEVAWVGSIREDGALNDLVAARSLQMHF